MSSYGGLYQKPQREPAYIDGGNARSRGEDKNPPSKYCDGLTIYHLWLAGWHDKDIELNQGCSNQA